MKCSKQLSTVEFCPLAGICLWRVIPLSVSGGSRGRRHSCGVVCSRVQRAASVKRVSTAASPLQFRVSPYLWAEPLKKKKKADPMVEKQRIEKKKKKIMKEIKRLQKLDKQLKPIADIDLPNSLINDLERRTRHVEVPQEVSEERIRLLKEWTKYKLVESSNDIQLLQRLQAAQQKALDELRLESEELYQAAVQIDPNLIPLKYSGPTETPPKEDYPTPDGAYTDVSRKWT